MGDMNRKLHVVFPGQSLTEYALYFADFKKFPLHLRYNIFTVIGQWFAGAIR